MKNMKYSYFLRILLLVMGVMLLVCSGCFPKLPPRIYKMYEGPDLPEDEIAVLHPVYSQWVSVASGKQKLFLIWVQDIDGKPLDLSYGYNYYVHLMPGLHTVEIKWEHLRGKGIISFFLAEAGHKYHPKAEITKVLRVPLARRAEINFKPFIYDCTKKIDSKVLKK